MTRSAIGTHGANLKSVELVVISRAVRLIQSCIENDTVVRIDPDTVGCKWTLFVDWNVQLACSLCILNLIAASFGLRIELLSGQVCFALLPCRFL